MTSRYIVVEIPQDPSAYHIERPVLETDDDQRARKLRDEMRVAKNNTAFEAYDREDNVYLDSSATPNCVRLRTRYTSFEVDPQIISDGLGHDFQVMEARLYPSRYKSSVYVTIIIDQFSVPYPKSKSELYSERGIDDIKQSTWHDENGAVIHNDSLAYHLNMIRHHILETM